MIFRGAKIDFFGSKNGSLRLKKVKFSNFFSDSEKISSEFRSFDEDRISCGLFFTIFKREKLILTNEQKHKLKSRAVSQNFKKKIFLVSNFFLSLVLIPKDGGLIEIKRL